MLGASSRLTCGEDHVGIAELDCAMFELPGVGEDGMSGRNSQRKLGTARGSPRRSRTAKASRISRHAVKSRCAREWGGWGRLSDDGAGHYNPIPSEDPWGGGDTHLMAVHDRVSGPAQNGTTTKTTAYTKGGCKPVAATRMSGADLSVRDNREGATRNASLAAVLGKTRRTE
jgi:hypothetical protein